MNKEKLKLLQQQGWDTIRDTSDAIRTLTEENPIIIFEKDKIDTEEGISEDEIYSLPYGYNVDKYSTYQQGAIMEVHGSDVKLFLTGEEFGQVIESELEYIPFECQLFLLSYLENRPELINEFQKVVKDN